jgi:hypothetical protein
MKTRTDDEPGCPIWNRLFVVVLMVFMSAILVTWASTCHGGPVSTNLLSDNGFMFGEQALTETQSIATGVLQPTLLNPTMVRLSWWGTNQANYRVRFAFSPAGPWSETWVGGLTNTSLLVTNPVIQFACNGSTNRFTAALWDTNNLPSATVITTDQSVDAGVQRAFWSLVTENTTANTTSDPVGFHKVTLAPGKNFISAPMHNGQAYRGTISAAGTNSVTFSGSPGFTPGQFSAITNGVLTNAQYALVVVSDANAVGGVSVAGDWWRILGNTASAVTVAAGTNLPSVILETSADVLEVRKLTSIADLFGVASASILNGAATNFPNAATMDVVRFISGTSFAKTAHLNTSGGSNRYAVGFTSFGDGTTLTLEPDEPIMVERLATTTNAIVVGTAQSRTLTHYMESGPNAISSPFPLPATIGTSGLREVIVAAGATSADNLPNPAAEDVLREVQGGSFVNAIICKTSDSNFYAGFALTNAYELQPGRGWIYYVKPASGNRIWRQVSPF